MGSTLFQKVWDLHTVRRLPTGQTQLFIGLHLIHEVTTPQAFDMLRAGGAGVAFPERTYATVDHIVPTLDQTRPFADELAEQMISALERNVKEFGIRFSDLSTDQQGIVHVIGPELGLTQPGMTIACGDSHTSTHGAFGAVAFGIGTSQVRDVLASQCLAIDVLKVRRIRVTGALAPGVFAKDVILEIIARLGVKGGVGYAYEYGGPAVGAMTMDERMTICNMSIEGGARVGYVNPDQTTFDYMRRRRHAPKGEAFEHAMEWWSTMASDPDATYDDEVTIDGDAIEPRVTWGINPGQSLGVTGRIPSPGDAAGIERSAIGEALEFMGLGAGRANHRHEGGRGVHRVVHQLAAVRPAGSRPDRARAEGVAPRQGARRPRVERGPGCRRAGGARSGVPGGWLRVARRGLLDVPRDEPRPTRRARDLRVVLEPQLQGAPGQPDRADAADEPGDGRRRRDRGGSGGC